MFPLIFVIQPREKRAVMQMLFTTAQDDRTDLSGARLFISPFSSLNEMILSFLPSFSCHEGNIKYVPLNNSAETLSGNVLVFFARKCKARSSVTAIDNRTIAVLTLVNEISRELRKNRDLFWI